VTTSRDIAERRVAELDARDRERRIRAEERAVRSRAADAAHAERRATADRERWERVDAQARQRVAERFGHEAAKKVGLDALYRVFVVGGAAIAIPHRGEPTSHNGRHLVANHSPAWKVQARLQAVLGVNPGLAALLEGRHLGRADRNATALLVDPTDDELRRLR